MYVATIIIQHRITGLQFRDPESDISFNPIEDFDFKGQSMYVIYVYHILDGFHARDIS
jgi:hypothetical protein